MFKKRQAEKTSKPLLFVCKTCNRAFSMRQNMVMHAVACLKRRKEAEQKEQAIPNREDVDKNSGENDKSEPAQPVVEVKKEEKMVEDSPTLLTPHTEAKQTTPHHQPQLSVVRNRPILPKPAREPTPTKFDTDDILFQLSPSDEAKEEERNLTPPATPTSLALGRPKRNLKPKQFPDGTVSVRRKIPEVVRIQQADGSQVYKLRQDVEHAIAPAPSQTVPPAQPIETKEPSRKVAQPEDKAKATDIKEPSRKAAQPEAKAKAMDIKEPSQPEDIVKAKDTKGIRILIQGESVPLLDEDDEAKIAAMIDIGKLVCLKCKRQYASSSNLRRHAVRHLGWRRYKCKLCKFTSYNKSECKTHLRKCHQNEVATLLDGGLAPYIIDLGALLDEGLEEGSTKLNLSLPSTSENGTCTPTNPKTRSHSKEASPECTQGIYLLIILSYQNYSIESHKIVVNIQCV